MPLQVLEVIHCPGLGEDKKIKVRFIVVVCAKYGPLYFNYTTGTRFDGFSRLTWRAADGSQAITFPAEYKVRILCMLHCCHSHFDKQQQASFNIPHHKNVRALQPQLIIQHALVAVQHTMLIPASQ